MSFLRCFKSDRGSRNVHPVNVLAVKASIPPKQAAIVAVRTGRGSSEKGTGILIHRMLVLTSNVSLPNKEIAQEGEITVTLSGDRNNIVTPVNSTQTVLTRKLLPSRYFCTNAVLGVTVVACDPVNPEVSPIGLGVKKVTGDITDPSHSVYVLGPLQHDDPKGLVTFGEGRIVSRQNVQIITFSTLPPSNMWAPGSAGFDERGNFAFMVCDMATIGTTLQMVEPRIQEGREQSGVLVQAIRQWLKCNWKGNFDELVAFSTTDPSLLLPNEKKGKPVMQTLRSSKHFEQIHMRLRQDRKSLSEASNSPLAVKSLSASQRNDKVSEYPWLGCCTPSSDGRAAPSHMEHDQVLRGLAETASTELKQLEDETELEAGAFHSDRSLLNSEQDKTFIFPFHDEPLPDEPVGDSLSKMLGNDFLELRKPPNRIIGRGTFTPTPSLSIKEPQQLSAIAHNTSKKRKKKEKPRWRSPIKVSKEEYTLKLQSAGLHPRTRMLSPVTKLKDRESKLLVIPPASQAEKIQEVEVIASNGRVSGELAFKNGCNLFLHGHRERATEPSHHQALPSQAATPTLLTGWSPSLFKSPPNSKLLKSASSGTGTPSSTSRPQTPIRMGSPAAEFVDGNVSDGSSPHSRPLSPSCWPFSSPRVSSVREGNTLPEVQNMGGSLNDSFPTLSGQELKEASLQKSKSTKERTDNTRPRWSMGRADGRMATLKKVKSMSSLHSEEPECKRKPPLEMGASSVPKKEQEGARKQSLSMGRKPQPLLALGRQVPQATPRIEQTGSLPSSPKRQPRWAP